MASSEGILAVALVLADSLPGRPSELGFVMVMHAAFDLAAVVLIYRGWEAPVVEFFFR